jgi:hypothetical protein
MVIWELLGPRFPSNMSQCIWDWGLANFPTKPPTQNCTSLAFGRDCKKITMTVVIQFAMGASWYTGGTSSAESRMSEFLQIPGIGNIVEMTGQLTIQNVGVNIDAPVIMDFFPKLQRVGVLTIIGNPIPPVPSRRFFVILPGLQKLDQVGGLLIYRTTLPDVSSLSGLKCVGGMRFEDNVLLTSLEGVQDAQVGIDELRVGGVTIDLELARQPVLVGPGSLAPLKKMAGCDGGRVPGGTLFIDTACPETIDSWPVLCGILQNSDCGASSPPPPLESPPPPTP